MIRGTGDRALTLQLRRAQILPHWLAGKTSREIGELLGMRRTTVDAYVHRSGISTDYPRIEPRSVRRMQRLETLRRMHTEGASNAEIAAATGYKESSVRVRASEMGLVYTAGKRARLVRGARIPSMTAEELEIYDSLKHKRIPAQERYEITIRSTR